MSKLESYVKRATAAGVSAVTLWGIAVKLEGRPIRDRGTHTPALVRVFGLPVFRRSADGKRSVLGVALKDLK